MLNDFELSSWAERGSFSVAAVSIKVLLLVMCIDLNKLGFWLVSSLTRCLDMAIFYCRESSFMANGVLSCF